MTIMPVSLYPSGYVPMSNVTPFTYRDGLTFLEKLEDLASSMNDIITWTQTVNTAISGLGVSMGAVETDVTQWKVTDSANVTQLLDAMKQSILGTIASALVGGTTFDPTNGTASESISHTISRLYDYTRVFAYFASQHDALELTAAQIDALGMSARHYDIAPLTTPNATLDGV